VSNAPVVLGLDFGGTKTAAAVCDTSGARLGAAVVTSLAEQGAQASFDHGIQTARDLLATEAAGAPIAAVGVATFGVPSDDGVALAPAIDGWEALPIGRALRDAFPGVPVRLANDVKAAATAEVRWGVLAGADPALYLNLGTGLAAAVVSNGEVLTGYHGAAGEIGYNVRDRADLPAPQIRLEDMVSGRALQQRALRTAAEVFTMADTDDDLDGLITDFVDELAFHVVNLAILIDPQRIAVGGGLTRSWHRIGPRLGATLRAAVPYPPSLMLGRFPHDAPLLGAVALAVDAVTGLSRRQPVLAPDVPHPDGQPGSGTGAGHSPAITSTRNLA
jgi:glucokinase